MTERASERLSDRSCDGQLRAFRRHVSEPLRLPPGRPPDFDSDKHEENAAPSESASESGVDADANIFVADPPTPPTRRPPAHTKPHVSRPVADISTDNAIHPAHAQREPGGPPRTPHTAPARIPGSRRAAPWQPPRPRTPHTAPARIPGSRRAAHWQPPPPPSPPALTSAPQPSHGLARPLPPRFQSANQSTDAEHYYCEYRRQLARANEETSAAAGLALQAAQAGGPVPAAADPAHARLWLHEDETARLAAENARLAAENARLCAENVRATEENARLHAEYGQAQARAAQLAHAWGELSATNGTLARDKVQLVEALRSVACALTQRERYAPGQVDLLRRSILGLSSRPAATPIEDTDVDTLVGVLSIGGRPTVGGGQKLQFAGPRLWPSSDAEFRSESLGRTQSVGPHSDGRHMGTNAGQKRRQQHRV
ncbi:hypothetical protein GGX14DRAFT_600347 [Mycena pura]|uniref:Uncharacterized protein n=1 Tax=Mycena pura TaxID=153505 RepID=A0AAD6Y0X4_9AGAR|nr:hypothetical protein GGX14DRAFT_600347 [Mycena pura]